MRIAFVLHYSDSLTGASIAFIRMLQGLMPLGVIPYVIVPDRKGIYETLDNMAVHTLVLNYRPSIYSHCRTFKECLLWIPRMISKIIVNKLAEKKIAKYLIENEIDLVHTNVGIINVGYHAARSVGIPHIYHIREYVDILVPYFPSINSFYKQFDGMSSYSICITKDIQKHLHLNDKDCSRVIYDPIFSSSYSFQCSESKDYFLFVGRIEPVKGFDLLLQSYNEYVKKTTSPLRLLVAGKTGNNPYVEQQLKFIQNNQLSSFVELLGECNEVGELMRQARAIVIPSRHEGFGFCMPEAMLKGCLVIANNVGGTKEQLDNGLELEGQEIALRYETIEDLTRLLLEVSSHSKEAYIPYIERAYHTVNSLYSLKRHAAEVCSFYQEILTPH